MTQIFLEAGDYETITKAISAEERMAIEQKSWEQHYPKTKVKSGSITK